MNEALGISTARLESSLMPLALSAFMLRTPTVDGTPHAVDSVAKPLRESKILVLDSFINKERDR